MRILRALAPVVIAISAIAAICGAVAALIVATAGGYAPDGASLATAPFLVAAVAAPACVGAFVLHRRPRNRIAWILLLGALSVGVVMAADAAKHLLLHDDPRSTLGAWVGVLSGEWPVLFLWPLALAYLYPDGELPSPRWRIPWRITLVSAAGVVGLIPFAG